MNNNDWLHALPAHHQARQDYQAEQHQPLWNADGSFNDARALIRKYDAWQLATIDYHRSRHHAPTP
jgi:hypothetical protein